MTRAAGARRESQTMKARLFPLTFVCVLACALAAAARQAGGEPTHRLSLPGKEWALDVALPGFTVNEDIGPFKDAALILAHGTDAGPGQTIEVRLTGSRQAGDAAEFREFNLRTLKKGDALRAESLKKLEYKQIPLLGYREGPRLAPQHPFGAVIIRKAYFVKDDLWASVTSMSMTFDSAQERVFHSVIDSVRFADRSAAPVSSFDYFHRGRPLFKAADYPQAVENYRAALALERKERRLAPDAWRALVEQLANAHAALSDYASAKEVLEYGLAHDPAHFWFSYHLARVYAAAGDADNAVACLEKAAAIHKKADRRRLSGGGPPPDPSQDAVFARLKGTDRFKKAAKALR